MHRNIRDVFKKIAIEDTLPIIFAGSGVAKRYTSNKYDWKGLLVECISQYHSSPDNKYREYEVDVKYELGSKNANKFSVCEKIGTRIERDFNKEYYRGNIKGLTCQDSQNPLKVFISQKLKSFTLDKQMTEELDLFKNLEEKMLSVVTTNYDSFFEDYLFTKHEKVVGQDIFKKSEYATLFKIHGCISDPNSLVLTSDDYEKFKRKSRVLSAKFIHLFTENPVIFMGYSVSDENIRTILLEIFQCIDDVNDFKKFEERLILIEYDEIQDSPAVGTFTMLIEDIEISMTKISVSSYLPVLKEMQSLKRKVRFKEIKQIKDLVYDIVQDESGEKTKVVNLLNDESQTDDNGIIVAITKPKNFLNTFGITGIQSEDLFEDALTGSLESRLTDLEQIKSLMEVQIPYLLRGSTVLPFYKYLKMANDNNIELVIDFKIEKMLEMNVEDFLNASIRKTRITYANESFNFLDEIMESDLAISRKLNYLVLMSVYKSKPDEIRDFLMKNKDEIINSSGGKTIFRKMVCVYDMKKYKTPSKDSISQTNASY